MNSNRPSQPATFPRRRFVQCLAAATAAPAIIPASVLAQAGKNAPSNQLSLGLIGHGDMGTGHLRHALSQKGVRVTALCDINEHHLDRAKKLVAEAYGKPDVKAYRDFRELNADPSIDAVLIALPVHWHCLAGVDAIMQRKPLYLEKPVSLTFEEAALVRAAVRKQKTIFQLGTQQRSDRNFRWACELALNGRLGKLQEVRVAVPGGRQCETLADETVPDWLDWNRWVGPAPMIGFNEKRLIRDYHENMANFSLGFISCWGIHHLDIAQWGNGTEKTGPVRVEATGSFPDPGSCNTLMTWKARFEFADAAPISFANIPQFESGVRFIGDNGWVHVDRGLIEANPQKLLEDPQTKPGQMPIKLIESTDHQSNFFEAVRSGKPTIAGIETGLRSDTLSHLAWIAAKLGRKLSWDPQAEHFVNDTAADALLKARPMRGPWSLPVV